jgi:hypothetical protein
VLGQALPGPDIGADASDTRPEHRHHSRPAMYLQCTRAAQGLAPVPRTFVPRAPTPSPATHTCCARHLPAEILQLECDCTPHCPHSSPQLNMVALCERVAISKVGYSEAAIVQPDSAVTRIGNEWLPARNMQAKGMPLITLTPGEFPNSSAFSL